MPQTDKPTARGIGAFLTMNPFEKEGSERVEWEDLQNEPITITAFETGLQYDAEGKEMRYAALRFWRENPDEDFTTLVWSAVVHDQLVRVGQDNLPVLAKLEHYKGKGPYRYIRLTSV